MLKADIGRQHGIIKKGYLKRIKYTVKVPTQTPARTSKIKPVKVNAAYNSSVIRTYNSSEMDKYRNPDYVPVTNSYLSPRDKKIILGAGMFAGGVGITILGGHVVGETLMVEGGWLITQGIFGIEG